jgi:hypothetical protein
MFMTELKAKESPATEIERRAYELYLERGGGDGHDVDDWVQAERELRARTEKSQLGTQSASQAEPRRTVERSSTQTTERSNDLTAERSADRDSLSDSLNSSSRKRL